MRMNLIGYAPDLDYTTPGVVTDCAAVIPSTRGMKGAPSAITGGAPALAAACYGAAIGIKLDNSFRAFAGTTAKLYELSGSAWVDVTRASGGDYSTGTSNRWRFAQFGNTSIAVNGVDLLQSSSSGAFANIASSPIARCIDTVSGFVMLGGVNLGGGAGMEYDRWICSAFNDETDWTPAVATQCTTGRLVDTPGPITAIRRLGYNCIAYKDRSIYVGTDVGAPAVWDWQLVPGNIGCASQEAIVNIGSAHIFVGYEDIYIFDGSRPVPIGEGIRDTFFADLNSQYRNLIIGTHDFLNGLVYFYYPGGSSAVPNKCIVYSYKTGKWGRDDRTIEAACEFLTSQVTYANIGNYFASYAEINVSYDSPFWVNSSPVVAVVGSDHTLYTLSGDTGSASITTGDLGDDSVYFLLTRDRPLFKTKPTTATMTNYYGDESGEAMTTDATTTISNGSFDVLRSSAWHRLKYDFTGNFEMVGHDMTLIQDGEK